MPGDKSGLLEEWGWQYVDAIQDWTHATPLLLGHRGTSTCAHLDWSSALNIAFAWSEVWILAYSVTSSNMAVLPEDVDAYGAGTEPSKRSLSPLLTA